MSDCRSGGHMYESQLSNITYMEIDHQILSLIQDEGQLSVTGKSSCIKYLLTTKGTMPATKKYK